MAKKKAAVSTKKPRKKGYTEDEIKDIKLEAYRRGYSSRDQEIKDFVNNLLDINEIVRYAADQAVYNTSSNCKYC